MSGKDLSLCRQLAEARSRILVQLDELRSRPMLSSGTAGTPDCSAVVAELEDELREINKLLGADDGASEGGESFDPLDH